MARVAGNATRVRHVAHNVADDQGPHVATVAAKAAKPAATPMAPVRAVPRRELLTTGAALAAVLLGGRAAQAAGESSATRAITAVTRPQQLKKKNDNREALKEQVEKVRAGEADPKSLP